MKHLSFEHRSNEHIMMTAAPTFEDLWNEAERFGRVSLETTIGGTGYRATIHFTTPTGSSVFAHGTDRLLKNTALEKAIAEARRLNAL